MTPGAVWALCILVSASLAGLCGGMLATGHSPIFWGTLGGWCAGLLILNAIGAARSDLS